MSNGVFACEHAAHGLLNFLIERGMKPSELRVWPEPPALAAAVDPRISIQLPHVFGGCRVIRRPWGAAS